MKKHLSILGLSLKA
jgi:hypothetical protein